jgi:hypothetical protein
LALRAICAGAAGHGGAQRDLVADSQTGDASANLRHDARHFVAQGHRFLQAHRAKAAVVAIMKVRPANAAPHDRDTHLLRGRCGRGRLRFDA